MRERLIEYGYLWLGMKEVSYDFAIIHFKDNAIYKLYEDNTESLAESIDDIKNHYENGGKLGIELNKYDDYVVFLLGRDLLKGILPLENDIAYEWCINLAKDFKISNYNVNTKGLYTCLEEYVNNNFIKDRKGNWTFKGKDIYNVCGGVR